MGTTIYSNPDLSGESIEIIETKKDGSVEVEKSQVQNPEEIE